MPNPRRVSFAVQRTLAAACAVLLTGSAVLVPLPTAGADPKDPKGPRDRTETSQPGPKDRVIFRPTKTNAATAMEPAAVEVSNFVEDVVISGLELPTAIAFAPNGHIFVAEKTGRIMRYTSLTDSNPVLAADLSVQVYNYWDKGLLGLAVDPAYPSRPFIYAMYSFNRNPLTGSAWTGGGSPLHDDCPNPPGPTGDGCVSTGRLSKLTLNTSGVMTGEQVLINDWCDQFPSHSVGTVLFGPDGYLYASAGEGASFTTLDYGQLGGTRPNTTSPVVPRNPCGDPPGGVGGSMTPPTAQGGALRSQSKRRPSGQPVVLSGTLIRVHPDTGAAVATNPGYASGRDENERRIIAYGLRNPFRFTFHPTTGAAWIGDVGHASWEEINRHPNPTGAVLNFGWPCYEGWTLSRHSGYDNLDLNSCETLYAAGAAGAAETYWAYRHGHRIVAGESCPTGSSSITGVAFYNGGSYPASFNGALFFADYSRRCIWYMRAGSNGLPDPGTLSTFITGAAAPVDLRIGPGGDLFYVDLNGGTVRRIRYATANNPPVVVASANPTSGPSPLTVNYDASGSYDPDGDSISFAWDLTGNGQFTDATGPTASRTYSAGTYTTGVRVTDSRGASSTKAFTISAGNNPPTAIIDEPAATQTWAVGETITYRGRATDPDEGDLPAARLSWTFLLHHCPKTNDCHTHNLTTVSGVSQGTFTLPDHEWPSYLEIRLTATNSGGLTHTARREIHPRPVDLTFATDPAGLQVSAAGELATAPFTRRFIVNSAVALSAPQTQTLADTTYEFASWSDGGGRSHTIAAPATDTTYTAHYTASAEPPPPPPPPPPPASSPPDDAADSCAAATYEYPLDTWHEETIASSTDVDWFLFRIPQASYARIVLGNLPKNYRLDLYSACNTKLAASNESGRQFEEIWRSLPAGTYRVRVRGVSNAFDRTNPYALRFSLIPAGVQVVSSHGWVASGVLNIDGEVVNNTSDRRRLMVVEATYFNAAGQELARHSNFAYVNVLAPLAVSPFRVALPVPAAYARYELSVSSQPTTDALIGNLAISGLGSTVGSSGLTITGTVTNKNKFSVVWTQSLVTLYDRWGNAMNTSADWVSPTTLAAGAKGTLRAVFATGYSGWNRYKVQVQATRG